MEFKDYYDILGIQPDADAKAVKTAYRRLARKYHPDVSKEKNAENQFKDVSEAYEVLSDTAKRTEYDQLRQYGHKGQSFTPPPGWTGGATSPDFDAGQFSEFFSSIFGDRFQQSSQPGRQRSSRHTEDVFARRGQDVEIELPVFLEDLFKDDAKTVEFLLQDYQAGGRSADIKKSLKVKLPKGSVDGQRIRLKGQGGPGQGEAAAGDVYLKIMLVPHPLFDVHGHNLTITVPIAPWEAALGTTIKVPTLQGRISLSISPEAQTGQRLRVKGKGLPTRNGHGDLFVVLKIVMPAHVDAESKRLWQEMASESSFNPRSALEK